MPLHSKLVEIRRSVEYLQKTERGNQGAMYVDPAVLIQRIRSKMDEHQILLVPSLLDCIIVQISDPTKNNPDAKSWLFKSPMAYTFICAESGETLVVPWFLTGKHLQDPAMAGGAALTYYERYFLLKFFQIPTSKDDPEHFSAKTATAITDAQVAEINRLIADTKTELPAFLKYAGVEAIEDIPPARVAAIKSLLLAKAAKMVMS
jgi:hypothetical protein